LAQEDEKFCRALRNGTVSDRDAEKRLVDHQKRFLVNPHQSPQVRDEGVKIFNRAFMVKIPGVKKNGRRVGDVVLDVLEELKTLARGQTLGSTSSAVKGSSSGKVNMVSSPAPSSHSLMPTTPSTFTSVALGNPDVSSHASSRPLKRNIKTINHIEDTPAVKYADQFAPEKMAPPAPKHLPGMKPSLSTDCNSNASMSPTHQADDTVKQANDKQGGATTAPAIANGRPKRAAGIAADVARMAHETIVSESRPSLMVDTLPHKLPLTTPADPRRPISYQAQAQVQHHHERNRIRNHSR